MFKRLAKTLVSLCICTGWSEPLLVAHNTLLEMSCCGSYLYIYELIAMQVMQNIPIPKQVIWLTKISLLIFGKVFNVKHVDVIKFIFITYKKKKYRKMIIKYNVYLKQL